MSRGMDGTLGVEPWNPLECNRRNGFTDQLSQSDRTLSEHSGVRINNRLLQGMTSLGSVLQLYSIDNVTGHCTIVILDIALVDRVALGLGRQ